MNKQVNEIEIDFEALNAQSESLMEQDQAMRCGGHNGPIWALGLPNESN